jgi:phosphohistidine phosphatase
MKTLIILRHAKSSWKDDSLADHERPLNKRGQKDAARMGELLHAEGLQPDLILCSSAVRARETARIAIEASGYESEIEYRDDLYAFEPSAYLNALLKLADTCDMVMLIGHNPALEELLNGLSGEYHSLPTAALAQVELPTEAWKEISFGMRARLVNLWRPKEV